MLGFILSKMNLLILVTAIFAIVAFFAFGLTDISKVKEASELVTRINVKAEALANSPSYCIGDAYRLEPDLRIAGSTFFYALKITKSQIDTGNGSVNVLVFSAFPREEIKRSFDDSSYTPKAIAANSFRTNAEVYLYSQDYTGSEYTNNVTDGLLDFGSRGEAFADPQARNPADSLEFVKEVVNGQARLHVIVCNSAFCEAWKTEVGKIVRPPSVQKEGGFAC